MARRSKKGRKSSSKSKSINDPESPLLANALSKLNILSPEESNDSRHAADEEGTLEQASFRFDGVCDVCQQLYVSKISTTSFERIHPLDEGKYIGSLTHISSSSECSMCRKLYGMRWSTSTTNEYYLHAFSASRMVHGCSLESLRTRSSRKNALELKDNVLFAVVADCYDPVLISFAVDTSKTREFLVSININSNGEQPPPPLVGKEEDDENHALWLYNEISSREQQYSRLSINVALQQAKSMGFINEFESMWRCRPTSLAELEVRRADGDTNVNVLTIQPTETGDPNNWRSLDYVPSDVQSNKMHQIQSLCSDGFYGRAIDPGKIDYSLLRGWIRQCQNRCSLEDFIKERRRFQSVPFFLLDCENREVFKDPSKRLYKYVALSYVWGNVDMKYRPCISKTPFVISDRCPPTIEDAIVLTLELGYRYLWIDSLCISPDASLRHNQIANMDVVYKNAELTIVAAAGQNADYGLPGVGNRQRREQTEIKIGKHHFVATTTNPNQCLETSIYQTRGWTYQEYFFSRRMLVFSDFQVTFECRSLCLALHQQESLSCPPHHRFNLLGSELLEDEYLEDAYFKRLSGQLKDDLYGDDGSIVASREIARIEKLFALLSYEHHVSQFTKRKLSMEEDSLQAVSSILDRFTTNTHSIYHLHGIPFIPQDVYYINTTGQKHDFKFKYGLLWTHGPLVSPIRRRSAFPSWSWTGWEAKVNWLVSTTDINNFQESPAENVHFDYLRSTNGKKSQLCAIDKWRPSLQPDSHPKELVFTAIIYKIPLRASAELGGEQMAIYLDAEERFKSRLHVTQISLDPAKLKQTLFHGLWLGTNSDLKIKYVLVIQQTASRGKRFGGKYYERVGVIMISESWDGWKGPLGIQGFLV